MARGESQARADHWDLAVTIIRSSLVNRQNQLFSLLSSSSAKTTPFTTSITPSPAAHKIAPPFTFTNLPPSCTVSSTLAALCSTCSFFAVDMLLWAGQVEVIGGRLGTARPANGCYVDACKEMAGVWFVVDVSWGKTDPGTGILYLRMKYPSIFVSGMYFGKLGLERWLLWGKRILGAQEAIMTWHPIDVVVMQERKWCGEEGTCQQFFMHNKIDFPAEKTRISTSPVPSIVMLFPKAVQWTWCLGMYVVKRDRSLMIWDGRVTLTTTHDWTGHGVAVGIGPVMWQGAESLDQLDCEGIFEEIMSRNKNKWKKKWN